MARRLKQFAYLCLFLVFWGGVVGLFYRTFFVRPPSCFDTVQNQGEEGPDCGGPCKTLCISKTLIPPSALSAPQVFQPAAGVLSVLLELKNPNPTTAIRSVPYSVLVTGSSGAPLTLSGVTNLYASEVRRLVLVRSSMLEGPFTATLTITTSSAQWAAAQQFAKPELRVVDAQTSSSPDGTRVEGTIASDDALPVTDVTVLGVFYDSSGQLLGASQTVLQRLAPGASSRFTISSPELIGIDPSATQVTVTAYRP